VSFGKGELNSLRLGPRLRFCDYIPDSLEKENALNSLTDGVLFSVMAGLTNPFWGAFAVQLGASDYMLGLLTSLPALANLLAQIPAAIVIDKFDNRLEPTLKFAFISRSFYLVFAFLPIVPLPSNVKAWTFIICYTLMRFPGTICDVAWLALMGELFTPSLRARIFAERNMVCSLVSLVATLVAGKMLDALSWPVNYAILYFVGYIFVMGSWYYLGRLKEKPRPYAGENARPAGLEAFKVVWKDKGFLRFIAAVAVVYLGFHIPAALWTILWVKIMGLSNSWLGMFSTISGVMSFLSYNQWGKWSEKHGNLKVFIVTSGAHIIFPLLYGHFPSPYVHLAINALSGFFGAGLSLCLFNALLDLSSDVSRPAYTAVYNITLGVSAFIWPMVGVSIYEMLGMTATLDLTFGIRVLGVAIAAYLLSDQIKRGLQDLSVIDADKV